MTKYLLCVWAFAIYSWLLKALYQYKQKLEAEEHFKLHIDSIVLKQQSFLARREDTDTEVMFFPGYLKTILNDWILTNEDKFLCYFKKFNMKYNFCVLFCQSSWYSDPVYSLASSSIVIHTKTYSINGINDDKLFFVQHISNVFVFLTIIEFGLEVTVV